MVDGIRELDMIEKGRSLIEDERLKKDDISTELESMILLEEGSWMLKSRALWLREAIKVPNSFIKWQTCIEEINWWTPSCLWDCLLILQK